MAPARGVDVPLEHGRSRSLSAAGDAIERRAHRGAERPHRDTDRRRLRDGARQLQPVPAGAARRAAASSIRRRAIRRRSTSANTRGAPTVSLTDFAWKIVFTRLGDRLRVAGTAELSGYDTRPESVRCEALVRGPSSSSPTPATATARVLDRTAAGNAVERAADRATRYRNLYLDTGHGTLGWTMACGSARALADVVAGRKPDVEFQFTGA